MDIVKKTAPNIAVNFYQYLAKSIDLKKLVQNINPPVLEFLNCVVPPRFKSYVTPSLVQNALSKLINQTAQFPIVKQVQEYVVQKENGMSIFHLFSIS